MGRGAGSVTVSNFTPKPHTPFQWHSVSTAEFERKHQLLRDAFQSQRLQQVRVDPTNPLTSDCFRPFGTSNTHRV